MAINIPDPEHEYGAPHQSGNANKLGDVGRSPRKNSLFFLTCCHPEIGLSEDRVTCPSKIALGIINFYFGELDAAKFYYLCRNCILL